MSRLSRKLRSLSAPPPQIAPALAPPSLPPTPYEHLLYVPRYQMRWERLLGQDFRICDGISFYASYREIFQDEIYRFDAPTRSPAIIDCGANVGVSVVYFKRLFPQARITAVEADPRVFELLRWNLLRRGLTDVHLVNKAVAHGVSEVSFHREGADAGRIHALAESKDEFRVPTVSLDDLIQGEVDLLKLDIEGAETDVLCNCEQLDRVSQIFVEYHSFADSLQSLHRLLVKLAESGFRYYVQTQYCGKQPLVRRDCHLGMDLQLNIFATRANGDLQDNAGAMLQPKLRIAEFEDQTDATTQV